MKYLREQVWKIKAIITNQEGFFYHFNVTGISVNMFDQNTSFSSWSVGSEMLFYCVDMRMCSCVFNLTPVLQASCLFHCGLMFNFLEAEDSNLKISSDFKCQSIQNMSIGMNVAHCCVLLKDF